MKGTLTKTEQGWRVQYDVINSIRSLPLHRDDISDILSNPDSKIENLVGKEVEFEIVKEYIDSHTNQVQSYAKLINHISDISKMVEDDVEKLAEHYSTQMEDVSDNLGKYLVKAVYIDGYNKAKENTYTEEQVREAIDMATTSKYDYKLNFYSSDEIIQSLKSKKNN